MSRRREKLITAAMLIVLFLLARSAGGAVISPSATDYTISAGGSITVGTGTRITGSLGAGGDVTFAADVMVFDLGASTGDVFSEDDVSIGGNSYIAGRVMADDSDGSADGVLIGDNVTITGRIDGGGGGGFKAHVVAGNNFTSTGGIYAAKNVTVGTNSNVTGDIHAGNLTTIGNYSVTASIWGKKNISIGTSDVGGENVVVNGDIHTQGTATFYGDSVGYGDVYYKRNNPIFRGASYITGSEIKRTDTPTGPDSYTYNARTWSSANFDRTATLPADDRDITSDAELAAGTYRDLIVRAGVTLTVNAGTYDFRNITLEDGANISIKSGTNPGDVIIQAFEDLFTAGNNVLGRVGQAQLVLNIGNLLTIGSGSTVAAHLLAYSDTVTSIVDIGGSSLILGKVYSAGNVIIGDNVNIPEPDTLVLLGIGGMGMLVRRRRRGKSA